MYMHNPQPTQNDGDTSHVPFAHPLEEGLPAEEVHRRAVEARKRLAHAQRALSFYLVDMEKRASTGTSGAPRCFSMASSIWNWPPHDRRAPAKRKRNGKTAPPCRSL